MDYERQQHAPIYEALERFRKKRVVPFDVPGHKRGRGNPELAQLLGEKCVGLDEVFPADCTVVAAGANSDLNKVSEN